jgi:hypothetical protein
MPLPIEIQDSRYLGLGDFHFLILFFIFFRGDLIGAFLLTRLWRALQLPGVLIWGEEIFRGFILGGQEKPPGARRKS